MPTLRGTALVLSWLGLLGLSCRCRGAQARGRSRKPIAACRSATTPIAAQLAR